MLVRSFLSTCYAAVSILACAGCTSKPALVTPCRDAREFRAQAKVSNDAHERAVLSAKAEAAEERCRQSGRENSARAAEYERRRLDQKAIEEDR
jgi:hypothetical protein